MLRIFGWIMALVNFSIATVALIGLIKGEFLLKSSEAFFGLVSIVLVVAIVTELLYTREK